MKSYTTILAAAGLIASVSAHGIITDPAPRGPGPAFQAACGMQAYYQVSSDPNGNVQGLLNIATQQPDYKAADCRAYMCKGLKYADNTDKVQRYTAGQVVPITFATRAPHTGTANVSIVRTSDDTVIGQPLKSWDNFAPNAGGASPDQASFTVTIPDTGSQCTEPGACILQHFWDANKPDIDQTYESCVDVVISGGSGGAPAPAPSSSAPAVTSAAAPVASSSTQPPVQPVTTTAAPVTTTRASTTRRPRPTNTCACNAPVVKRQDSCNPTATVTVTEAAATDAASTPGGYGSTITRTATVTVPATATITNTVTITPPAEVTVTQTLTQTSTITSAVTVTASTSRVIIAPTTSSSVSAPFTYPNATAPVQNPALPGTTVNEASTSLATSASFTFNPLPTGATTVTVTSSSTAAPFPTATSANSSTADAVPTGTGVTSRPAATLSAYPTVPVGGDSTANPVPTSSSASVSVPIGTGVTSVPAGTLPGSSPAPYPTSTFTNTNPDGTSTANGVTSAPSLPTGTGVISSIASLTSLIPTASLNSTIPTGTGVYSSLSSLISSLPTASGSPGYGSMPPRPTPGSGSSIADLLRWIADLITRAKAEKEAGATPSAPAPSATPAAGGAPVPYVYRRAARDFRPFNA
ncbi:hypothetical protein B9Z65_4835 [Elsinoe australis]|uniref:Chitin-binding type-4 domain-containing protein n=1 Tax=Elsinoe australis TaxID=40998 RepID=A0A2P8A674_9PEZI|nr:hypothetical protein B9Z65_4835 [Elsinoe australis]